MGNRFKEAQEKAKIKTEVPVVQENVTRKKEKYKIMVRVAAELEEPLKKAAEKQGLPIARFVEIAIREKLGR